MCICTCVGVCRCVCMSVGVWQCRCVCTSVGVCIHTHVYTVYTCACVCACLHEIHKHGYFKNYYTMYCSTYTFVWIFGPLLSSICIVCWNLYGFCFITWTTLHCSHLIQDILSGTDLNKMVSLVEMMIENHTELFEVPQQVQLPAREFMKRKRSGEVRYIMIE